jgi:heat shock protein HslJ
MTFDDLVGRTFLAQDATQDGVPYALVDGSVVRLHFADGAVGGSGGCNQLGGDASLDGDVLVVGALAMTEMACDEPLMTQDQWLADLLTGRPTLVLDGDQLVLTGGGFTVTLLDEETVTPDASLERTEWVVTSLVTGTGDEAAVASIPDGVASGLLLRGGNAAGSDGCNRFRGTYTVDGDQLTLAGLAMTRMACSGARGEVADHMDRLLAGAMTYSIDGDRLTLVNGELGAVLTAS